MRSSVFERRRFERFARLIESAQGGPRHHGRTDLDDELGELVALACRLRGAPVAPAPASEFRSGLRSMLLAMLERDRAAAALRTSPWHAVGAPPQSAPRPGSRGTRTGGRGATPKRRAAGGRGLGGGSRRTRAAVLVGVAAGALALAGVPAAAGQPSPEPARGQVKRSSERAQLALAGSDQGRGKLYLEFARGRLLELADLDDEVARSSLLSEMDSITLAGVRLLTTAAAEHADAAVLVPLAKFASAQRRSLLAVLRDTPDLEILAARRSLLLLEAIDRRARELAGAIVAGAQMARADELGPRPAS
jgi:hypothetical protein